jgi:hypothetical protein
LSDFNNPVKFFKTVIEDLKNEPWPEGTTDEYKNEYRIRLVGLLAVLAVAAAFVHPFISIIPAAIAIRKLTLIYR